MYGSLGTLALVLGCMLACYGVYIRKKDFQINRYFRTCQNSFDLITSRVIEIHVAVYL